MTTQTKTKDTQTASDQPRQRQDVAVLQPARLPYHPVYQERYGVDGVMWRALVEAVYPSAKTVEGIILAVSYCRSKGYDVMKKMVNVVPIWNSSLKKEVEGVWEAVSALRATAFRTGEYAGCDETKFGPTKTFHFDDELGYGDKAKRIVMDVEMPEWAQVTVYRLIQGQRCAFPGPRVTYLGAYGCRGKSEIPNEKWAVSGDSYMLEKCAEAAALRKAFPEELGGINAAEEMEGRRVDIPAGQTIDHGPPPPRPTRESVRAGVESARKGEYEMDKQYRETMREDAGARTTVTATDGQVTEGAHSCDPAALKTETVNMETGEVTESEGPQADYSSIATDVLGKIGRVGTLKAFNNLLNATLANDIELLKQSAPELAAKVEDAVAAKKRWFAR